ncbi:uncharacterized protein CTRU02_209197 [Colletotrichum truncatum]|uniref:Uncharacterized protein n=1 Tax=Colletotrichum truncatum TaxID=5467 RepID=A0ACC3YZK8_COLTU|nr:uncharacterized protein CTRU02_15332 [Colletotrichum truncatum]KAF6781177.1 hypothetical protein CTRU02_15332 [Colletotrichum truncatum]
MRLGSAGLLALLWSYGSNIVTASPLAEAGAAMPGLRPRQQSGTGVQNPPTTSTTPPTTSIPITSAADEATTTITQTVTQGGGAGGTVTVTSASLRTIITTVVVTTTTFETTTITSNDVATATVTNYVTSTVLAKRSINFFAAEAAPVDAPAAQITPAADADLRKYAFIEKRALVTVTVTVSGSAGADSTVTVTQTSTVVRTTTSALVQTSTITSVQYNNAQTTVTVTSTLIVTSTSIDTSSPSTVASGPTTGAIATETSSSSGGSGSGDSDGLSTGAKAGIGAGVGVVGLLALLGGAYWLYKRRKANRPSAADLADMRAYDPNGPSPLDHTHMSETGAGLGAAGAAAHRRQPPPRKSAQLSPPTASVSPMSNQTVTPANDYGSGFARPPANGANELGDTRVLPAEMGGDEVVEMGDGQPRPPPPQQPQPGRQNMTFQSGPVPDVYEMPTERYR